MKRLIIAALFTLPLTAFAQLTTTLEACYEAAETQFPLNGQSALLQDITDNQILKINAIWQPKLYLNAQATYQSDVTSLPISFPGIEIPELSRDQYRITLDLNQVLYDGGQSAQQKAVARQQLAVEEQKLEVDRYKVHNQVNQAYMAILMADARLELIVRTQDELRSYLSLTEAGRQFGVASDMQVLELRAELLRLEQQYTEVSHLRSAAIDILRVLTALPLDSATVFTHPQADLPTAPPVRPELELYSRQKSLFDLQRSFAEQIGQPTLSLFAQGGYGRPGLNMLLDSFEFYYIGGIRLQYPLWTGQTRRRDAAIYSANASATDLQQLYFNQSINLQSVQYEQDIKKYTEQISQDDSILKLREQLFQGATVQFEQGVVSTREVLGYLHDRDEARITREVHQLQLLATKVNYLTTLGQR